MIKVLVALLTCVALTRGEEGLENKPISSTKADKDTRRERNSDSSGMIGNYFTIGGHDSYGLQQSGGIQNILGDTAYGVLESNKNIGGINLDGGMIFGNNFGGNLFGAHDFGLHNVGLNGEVNSFHHFQGNGDYLHSLGGFGFGGHVESSPSDLNIGKPGLHLYNIGSTGLAGYNVGEIDNRVQNLGGRSIVGGHETALEGFGSHIVQGKFGGYENGGVSDGEDKLRRYLDYTVALTKIPVEQSVNLPQMPHDTDETPREKEQHQKAPITVPLPVKVSPPNTIKTTMTKMEAKAADVPSGKQVPYTFGKLLPVDTVKQLPYTIPKLYHMYLYNHNV